MPVTDSYGEAHDKAMAMLAESRLADPDEHFPYKDADAKAALKRKNMGPDAGEKEDVTGADFLSQRIVEASSAFIAAQEAYLREPTAASHSAMEAAQDDLIAARRTHRRGRVDADGNPVANVVGTTRAPQPEAGRVGTRSPRVGEEV